MIRYYRFLAFCNEQDFNRNAERWDDYYIVDYHLLKHRPNRFPVFFVKKRPFDNHSMGWLMECDPELILDAVKKEINVLNSLEVEIKRLMGE